MRRAAYLAMMVAMAMSAAYSAFAASSATLQVSANVLPFVSFHAIQHVATYRVRSEDVKRGYVDLPASMTVNIRTNLPTGVPVMYENTGGARVLIRESGRAEYAERFFTLNTDSYRPNTPISRRYDFRVLLSGDTKDGIYPLAISMAPAI